MNQEIIALLERLEFHEHPNKQGLWVKELHDFYSTTAYVDFRQPKDSIKGWRYATCVPSPEFDSDTIEYVEFPDEVSILKAFKEARDKILKGDKPSLQQEGEHAPLQSSGVGVTFNIPPRYPSPGTHGTIPPVEGFSSLPSTPPTKIIKIVLEIRIEAPGILQPGVKIISQN